MASESQAIAYPPHMVLIKQPVGSNVKLCGGSILTSTVTLTAAHCFLHGLLGLQLYFGSPRLFEGTPYDATATISHPDFNQDNFDHDIGLISIFPRVLNFGSNLKPVKLPRISTKLKENTLIRIYGWGAVSENASFAESLQSAVIPVIDKKICRKFLRQRLPKNTFCLGYFHGQIDSCAGDSGGPAMLGDVQVGIISFGEGCAQALKPGVYTDLRKYLLWLNKTLESFL